MSRLPLILQLAIVASLGTAKDEPWMRQELPPLVPNPEPAPFRRVARPVFASSAPAPERKPFVPRIYAPHKEIKGSRRLTRAQRKAATQA